MSIRKIVMSIRKTEQMLSDMADKDENILAATMGLTVAQLRDKQRNCKHNWESFHYYDECSICGVGRA